MRACTRLVLVLIAVFVSLGLAGCVSVNELKDTMSGWFDTEKSQGAHEGKLSGGLPDVADRRPPEGIVGEEASKASKKKDTRGSKLQRPQTVELPKKPPVSPSSEAVRPHQGADAQSASPQVAPVRLQTPWPEAPASGTFSR
jgi:hypothetical protein